MGFGNSHSGTVLWMMRFGHINITRTGEVRFLRDTCRQVAHTDRRVKPVDTVDTSQGPVDWYRHIGTHYIVVAGVRF